MKIPRMVLVGCVLMDCVLLGGWPLVCGVAGAQPKEIPPVLKPWEDWVTWKDPHGDCPTPYNNAQEHLCFWPSRLSLSADGQAGSWKMALTLFEEAWVPLPGGELVWPHDVRAGSSDAAEVQPVVVVEREGIPSARLPAGRYVLSGKFRWDTMPQRIAIPKEIGLVSLAVVGNPVPIPNWDSQGDLWLNRLRAEVADKDLLSVKVYRVIEDGIPMWLRSEIELTVSGKSREEQLGWILPEGWQLSKVDSPIPVAVDDRGCMKAQVRSGKWTIHAEAFRVVDLGDFRFAPDAEPIADRELIGFQADGAFRMAQIERLEAIDVTQTTFPEKWRTLPVYQWKTGETFSLVEKMRGMGQARPEGLAIDRQIWLDEDGGGLTYRDQIRGRMQQIWRLDVAERQQLGAVRAGGKGQLITVNPRTGAHGVEIRNRNLDLEAIGRVEQTSDLSATGWKTDVDRLQMTISLPPGWRLFALFGADWVDGDWLTAWSLLDLFLLLIFSMAVLRLWGVKAGVVAFLAFGLSYHEPGSPRLTWLFLLFPLALLRVVPEGAVKGWILGWKRLALVLLALCLVPFVARQIQGAIYPQLEQPGLTYAPRGIFWGWDGAHHRGRRVTNSLGKGVGALPREPAAMLNDATTGEGLQAAEEQKLAAGRWVASSRYGISNMLQDPKARIQTGPAEPEWSWNQVRCSWNSPVTADQQIRPIFISLPHHRLLTLIRLALLLALAAILVGAGVRWNRLSRAPIASAVLLMGCLLPGPLLAQIPDQQMLDQLRARLIEPADAYPHAAEIASARLQVSGGRMAISAEVHTALEVAIPLPGRFPVWSPISVVVDGQPEAALRRKDGFLWVFLPAGVHQVDVEGLLPDAPQWELAFLLRPRHVSIDAPDWKVTGSGPDGSVEEQLFFARRQQATPGEATYDRRHFQTIVAVDRHLEIGLVWQLRTEVVRISSSGKAVSLKVPLVAGERVLTAGPIVEDGQIDVRLGPRQKQFSWESELPVRETIRFEAPATDRWVERWHLVTSPVWNAGLSGLMPVFESHQENLIPTWHPWPGEGVTLSFSRPEATGGDTRTIKHVRHETSLGSRQRTTGLVLDLECSLGGDFVIGLDAGAEVTSLKLDGRPVPVRCDDGRLTVPVHPGSQSIEALWSSAEPLQVVAGVGQVTLPVEAANITTLLRVPENRWILWADGPLRGPAVRFWTILASAILAACVLASLPRSPLRLIEWVLLAIGLTQVQVAAALLVVGWFFLLAWRGSRKPDPSHRWRFNFLQLGLLLITLLFLVILVTAVGEGLLGDPEMFILGNDSSPTALQWFQPRAAVELPEPSITSISVWFYRLLMLCWALWLASALLRWLGWGWNQLTSDTFWMRKTG